MIMKCPKCGVAPIMREVAQRLEAVCDLLGDWKHPLSEEQYEKYSTRRMGLESMLLQLEEEDELPDMWGKTF